MLIISIDNNNYFKLFGVLSKIITFFFVTQNSPKFQFLLFIHKYKYIYIHN